jgi:hypothetical protein
MTHIELRFLRKTEEGNPSRNASDDDVVKIIKLDNDRASVTYISSTPGSRFPYVSMTFTPQQLSEYLYNTFWLLRIDEAMSKDCFISVQLTIPGYPVIIVFVKTLMENVQRFVNMIRKAYLLHM